MVDNIALRIAVDLVIRLEVGVAFVNVLTWQNVRAFVCVQTIRKFADIIRRWGILQIATQFMESFTQEFFLGFLNRVCWQSWVAEGTAWQIIFKPFDSFFGIIQCFEKPVELLINKCKTKENSGEFDFIVIVSDFIELLVAGDDILIGVQARAGPRIEELEDNYVIRIFNRFL